MEHVQQQQLVTAAVTLLAVVLIVRRTLVTQTMRVWALFAVPVIILVLMCFVISQTPMTGTAVLAIVIGAIAGGILGYLRGVHSDVKLGPRPGTLVVKGSVVLVAIILGAFAIRFGLRMYFASDPLTVAAVGDGVLAFAVGSVIVARTMLYLTYRRLLRGSTATVSRTL
jgi:hypothetical protein